MKDKLNQIGKIIAGILVIIILIQFLFVWLKYCGNFQDENYDLGLCVEKLVLILIPTEVTIVDIFESFPFILLMVLLFYWIFVSPHLNS